MKDNTVLNHGVVWQDTPAYPDPASDRPETLTEQLARFNATLKQFVDETSQPHTQWPRVSADALAAGTVIAMRIISAGVDHNPQGYAMAVFFCRMVKDLVELNPSLTSGV